MPQGGRWREDRADRKLGSRKRRERETRRTKGQVSTTNREISTLEEGRAEGANELILVLGAEQKNSRCMNRGQGRGGKGGQITQLQTRAKGGGATWQPRIKGVSNKGGEAENWTITSVRGTTGRPRSSRSDQKHWRRRHQEECSPPGTMAQGRLGQKQTAKEENRPAWSTDQAKEGHEGSQPGGAPSVREPKNRWEKKRKRKNAKITR